MCLQSQQMTFRPLSALRPRRPTQKSTGQTICFLVRLPCGDTSSARKLRIPTPVFIGADPFPGPTGPDQSGGTEGDHEIHAE
jgi:hypothetical protein